jgi:hypothetical protein
MPLSFPKIDRMMGGTIQETAAEVLKGKVAEVLKSLNELIPILKKNGYMLDVVVTEIGIPPKIRVVLGRSREATKNLESVMQQVGGDGIKAIIIKSLIIINKMQDTLEKSNFTICGVDIGVSFPPTITARIRPISD